MQHSFNVYFCYQCHYVFSVEGDAFVMPQSVLFAHSKFVSTTNIPPPAENMEKKRS